MDVSISAISLDQSPGDCPPPLIIDVRRQTASDLVLPHSVRRNPDQVEDWAADLEIGRASADQIVSFSRDLDDYGIDGRPIERWDECPAVSDDFKIAWSVITGRVMQLIDRLAIEGAAHAR
ncbi:MAG: Protein-tyrosine-phosphatase [Rhodospirillales bacterium]|nr:Protein-tyrosine-phosphatase [Rhodospirillales bacterium]